ncbi:AAA domain-containing protein, partial [uncultured Clostridium sp.]|uniref:AAA domain-containing protein n=1 Tax=uncultured Clostridium sp. TaxID=59620 RepID=UPI0025F88963
DKGIGIVAPHKAQKAKIQNDLLQYFDNYIESITDIKTREKLKEKIMSSVDTVEKYQGQQREIMICSYILGDRDIIKEEEEFIYNSNRLNVVVSRARFKIIILASQELLLNIGDDIEIVEEQKSFQKLITYCDKEKKILQSEWKQKNGIMRYKELK